MKRASVCFDAVLVLLGALTTWVFAAVEFDASQVLLFVRSRSQGHSAWSAVREGRFSPLQVGWIMTLRVLRLLKLVRALYL